MSDTKKKLVEELSSQSLGSSSILNILNGMDSANLTCSDEEYKRILYLYSTLNDAKRDTVKITRNGNGVHIEITPLTQEQKKDVLKEDLKKETYTEIQSGDKKRQSEDKQEISEENEDNDDKRKKRKKRKKGKDEKEDDDKRKSKKNKKDKKKLKKDAQKRDDKFKDRLKKKSKRQALKQRLKSKIKETASQFKAKVQKLARSALERTKKFNSALSKKSGSKLKTLINTGKGKVSGIFSSVKSGISKVFKSKAANKVVAKKTTAIVGKTAAKSTAKIGTKVAVKSGIKTVLKKIPGVSLIAGVTFGVGRVFHGDWKGAVAEVSSGALGCVPGVGTAASLAVDATLAGRDIHNANEEAELAENRIKAEQQAKEELVAKSNTAKAREEIKAKFDKAPQAIKKTKLSATQVAIMKNEKHKA